MSKSGGNYTYLSWKITAQLIFLRKILFFFFFLNLRYLLLSNYGYMYSSFPLPGKYCPQNNPFSFMQTWIHFNYTTKWRKWINYVFTNKMADKRILVRQDCCCFVPCKHFSEWSGWCLFEIVAWDKSCEERSRRTHCLQSVISETSISGI